MMEEDGLFPKITNSFVPNLKNMRGGSLVILFLLLILLEISLCSNEINFVFSNMLRGELFFVRFRFFVFKKNMTFFFVQR